MSDRIVTVFAVIGALVGGVLLWLILRNMRQEFDEVREVSRRRNMIIDRVRELHSPAPNGPVTCNGCQAFWPCSTIQALEGEA